MREGDTSRTRMTTNHFAEQMGCLAREVVASYEARVSSVEQIIEATHEMLETSRNQREAMRGQLRETLSRVASLRKRDFDGMMQGILARQEARERAVKEAMRGYLTEQRALAEALKEALTGGEAEQIGAIKGLLERIAARREAREREIKTLLAEFQSKQTVMVQALGGLLSNGGSVRVKEFKATLMAIQSQHWSKRAEGEKGSSLKYKEEPRPKENRPMHLTPVSPICSFRRADGVPVYLRVWRTTPEGR